MKGPLGNSINAEKKGDICFSLVHAMTPFGYRLTSDMKFVILGEAGQEVVQLKAKKLKDLKSIFGGKKIEILFDTDEKSTDRIFIYRDPDGNTLLAHDSQARTVPLTCK